MNLYLSARGKKRKMNLRREGNGIIRHGESGIVINLAWHDKEKRRHEEEK